MLSGIKHQPKIKTLFLIAIFSIAIFVFGPGKVYGQSFVEDFEEFELGTIYSQDGWDSDPSDQAGQITTTTAHTAPHSGEKMLFLNYYAGADYFHKAQKPGLEGRTSGRMEFWFYPANLDFLMLNLNVDAFGANAEVALRLDGDRLQLETGDWEFTNLALGLASIEWHLIQIEWNAEQKLRGKIDDGEWGDWYLDYEANFSSISNFGFVAYYSDIYIDDIKYGTWQDVPGPPVLEADFPVTATSSSVDFGTFNASGEYSYEVWDWNSLEIQLSDATTTYKFAVDITGEPTGTYEIPVHLPFAGTYNVKYIFYDYVTVFTEDFFWEDMFFYEVPIDTTTITVGQGIAPDWWDSIEIDTFEEEEPEAGTVQHYIWSIKEFFKGIILPSNEAKKNFMDTVLEIREKFPYNYIETIKDFFSTTSENIVQDPTIGFALLGAEGTAHASFFDVNVTMGSETKALFEWIKMVSTLFLGGGFLIYAINFIKRIF